MLDSKNFIATSAIDSKKFRSSSTVTLSLISPEKHILNYCSMLQKLSKCEVKDWLCWIWSFYCHSNFTWNQILANSNGPKMLILTVLEVLNFDFSKFEQHSSPKFTKNSKFRVSKIVKKAIFEIQILPILILCKIGW